MNVIVDLDGTLADNRHRLWCIRDEKKDWKAFYEKMGTDGFNMKLHLLIWSMKPSKIIILTGRPEEYRIETLTWLAKNPLSAHQLIMRPSGNFEKDYIFKEGILRQLEIDGIQPDNTIVFEDSDAVIEMFNRNGYMVFKPFWT